MREVYKCVREVFSHHWYAGICWIESHIVLWMIICWNQMLKSVSLPWPPFTKTMSFVAFSTWLEDPWRIFSYSSLLEGSAKPGWGTWVSEATIRLFCFWFGYYSSNIVTSHWIFFQCTVTPSTLLDVNTVSCSLTSLNYSKTLVYAGVGSWHPSHGLRFYKLFLLSCQISSPF